MKKEKKNQKQNTCRIEQKYTVHKRQVVSLICIFPLQDTEEVQEQQDNQVLEVPLE